MKSKILDLVAFILLVVGGLNWGLVAFNVNLVEIVFGSMPWLVTTVYVLVGLSAIYIAITDYKSKV